MVLWRATSRLRCHEVRIWFWLRIGCSAGSSLQSKWFCSPQPYYRHQDQEESSPKQFCEQKNHLQMFVSCGIPVLGAFLIIISVCIDKKSFSAALSGSRLENHFQLSQFLTDLHTSIERVLRYLRFVSHCSFAILLRLPEEQTGHQRNTKGSSTSWGKLLNHFCHDTTFRCLDRENQRAHWVPLRQFCFVQL